MRYNLDLVVKNFTCPDFHTCTLMDTFAVCEEKVKAGMQAVCQTVSVGMELVAKSCGKLGDSVCLGLTNLPERNMTMAIVRNEAQEKFYSNFDRDYLLFVSVCFGISVLGIVALKINEMSKPPEFLQKTESLSRLGLMLDYSNVSVGHLISVGHLNGSQISFQGIPKKATFRQVSNRIEQLYSKEVEVMRKKQETYEWSQSETKPMLRGIGGLLMSLPAMAVESVAKTVYSNRPSLTVEETRQVREAIEWRKRAYYVLDNLHKKSQAQLDADTSYTGKAARVWDKALDKVSTWRKTPIVRDAELLNQMGTNPPVVEPVKVLTGLELAHKESSRLRFGKELVLSVAHIVRDIALTMFYTFWVFTRDWKDNISSSFHDVRDDLGDFKIATIGIFSPSSAF